MIQKRQVRDFQSRYYADQQVDLKQLEKTKLDYKWKLRNRTDFNEIRSSIILTLNFANITKDMELDIFKRKLT